MSSLFSRLPPGIPSHNAMVEKFHDTISLLKKTKKKSRKAVKCSISVVFYYECSVQTIALTAVLLSYTAAILQYNTGLFRKGLN